MEVDSYIEQPAQVFVENIETLHAQIRENA